MRRTKNAITLILCLLIFVFPLSQLVSAAVATSTPLYSYTYNFGPHTGLPAPFNGYGAGHYFAFTYDGYVAYCLDKSNQNPDGNQNTVPNLGWLSGEQQHLLSLVMLYGYDGNTKYGYAADTERVATQICVWRISHGLQNNNDFFTWAMTGPLTGDVMTVVSQINYQVDLHDIIPSFTRRNQSQAVTYEPVYNPVTQLYEITLNDTRGVLRYYNLVAQLNALPNVTASRSGNNLIITSTEPFNNVLISGGRVSNVYTSSSAYLIRDISYATGNSIQDKIFIHGARISPDPVPAFFRLHNTGIHIIKTDVETGEPIEGVDYNLTGSDGTVWTATTNARGRAVFTGIPAGDYTVTEVKEAFGYVRDITVHEVTYSGTEVQLELTNEYKKGYVELIKLSSFNGKPLEGATYGLYRTSDDALMEWLVTDKDGRAVSGLYRYGNYYLKEEIAPDRYYIDLDEHHIVLGDIHGRASDFPTTDDAMIGLFYASYEAPSAAMLYLSGGLNVPNTGTEYELTDAEKLGYPELPKVGEVQTISEENIKISYLRPEDNPSFITVEIPESFQAIPEVKDDALHRYVIFGCISGTIIAFGVFYILYKKRQHLRTLFSFLLIGVMLFSYARIAKAEVVKDIDISEKGTYVTVEYDGLTEEDIPDTYAYRHTDGKTYELPLVDVTYAEGTLKNRTETIRGKIDYGEEEFIPKPQSQISVSYYDKASGKTITGILYFVSLVQVEQFHWVKSNDAPATFENYESAYYLMKNTKNLYVPYNDNKPEIAGLEKDIISAMGFDPARVRITEARWNGKAYTEKEILKRNAIFSTERFVARYVAYYEAVWDLPNAPGIRATAKYGSNLDLTAKEAAPSGIEPSTAVVTTAPPDIIEEPVKNNSIIKTILIGVGILAFVLLGILVILILVKKRKQKQDEETTE